MALINIINIWIGSSAICIGFSRCAAEFALQIVSRNASPGWSKSEIGQWFMRERNLNWPVDAISHQNVRSSVLPQGHRSSIILEYTVIIEDPLQFPMIYSVFGGRYIALKFCANISSPAINKIGIPPSPPVLSASADEFESDQFIKYNHHEDLGLPFICR